MQSVVVGLSGGVDSSVAAYLLKKEGFQVTGVTMRTWREGEAGTCPHFPEEEDVRRVAEYLEIPWHIVDFREVFRERVVDYFVREYAAGKTPNPCTVCNRHVKWESLLQAMHALGADCVATGHYASVLQLENGRWTLRTSREADRRSKDQSYALYNLTQDQLSRTIMPLGNFVKEEVRDLAQRAGIPVARKPDSEDICFVPDGDYGGFLERIRGTEDVPGNFVDQEGRVLGQHRGITHYTVGQRKRLGIALGRRMFVREIRPQTGEVVLAENEDLFSREVLAEGLNFMSLPELDGPTEVMARIRYNHPGAPAVAEMTGKDRLRCIFSQPQRAAAPGQALVLYKDGCLLGGGTIVR